MKPLLIVVSLFLWMGNFQDDETSFESDSFQTLDGELVITFIGHGTLMMEFDGKVIHIDPVSMFADYTELPKADLVLITHEHGDHLNAETLNTVTTESTEVVLTEACAETYPDGQIMKNGDSGVYAGIEVDAVPAYNLDAETQFHPKGNGNGYVLHFGDKKVYVAGDTENVPEMADLEDIDIAFLPMNLPYTMTPEMVADAASMFNPDILYPYHFGETDVNELVSLMEDQNDTEVRIRDLE